LGGYTEGTAPPSFATLLKRLERRRADRYRRTSMNRSLRAGGIDREYGGLYPPAPLAVIEEAEKTLGFQLPPLLREIYENLANGGFGPAYGLVGLAGGYTFEDLGDLPLVEYHRMIISDPENFHWPARLLNVCDVGCGMTYAIDCSQPDYPVMETSGLELKRVATFTEMMEQWADGRGESGYE
jgi:hypothetical protein